MPIVEGPQVSNQDVPAFVDLTDVWRVDSFLPREGEVLIVSVRLQIVTDILLRINHTPSFRHSSQYFSIDHYFLQRCVQVSCHITAL